MKKVWRCFLSRTSKVVSLSMAGEEGERPSRAVNVLCIQIKSVDARIRTQPASTCVGQSRADSFNG